jgi:hypothetical protein
VSMNKIVRKAIADMAAELKRRQAAVLPREEAEANLRRMLDQSKVQQRLYHGTTATEGGKGDEAIRRIKSSKEGALGSGAYLTPQPDRANLYTRSSRPDAGGNVLPVYAQIKNPLILDGPSNRDPMIEALTKLGMDEQKASRMVERAYENKGYIGKEVESRARAAGYDGLMQYRDGELAEVVSYNPNAIKSAIGNVGTYDTSVPELSKAHGGPVKMQDGGIMDAIEAAKAAGTAGRPIRMGGQPVDVEQMRREVEENARRVAQVKEEFEQDRLSRLPPAEMKAYDPSPRQQVGAAVQKGFSSLGAPISRARELSNVLTGGTTGGMSAIDVTPIGAAFLGQEGIERVAQNIGEGNYGTAALEAGLTALDVLPGSALARAAMKPAASAASKSLKPATKSLEDLRYETAQEGPFYRVRPRGYEQSGYLPYGTKEAQGESSGVVGRPVGSIVPKRIPDEQVDELISQPDNFVRQSVDQYSQEKFGRPYEMPQMPESSLLKQGPIGRVFELAATDNPQYKAAVFDAYSREMPEVVQQSGAKSYDELMARSYEQLAKETEDQFKRLPLNLSYHRAGEGDYDSSKDLLKDIYGNKHMYVFQGGDKHDFLNKVDPGTGLNTNEMFRAVHDFYGHALHGNQFGPKGEEIAWGAHSQTFSPLARLAMSSETRGQNSFVNYTPINAPLKKQIAEFDKDIAESKRLGDKNSVDELQAEKKRLLKSAFQYAPQKSVLLPPEFLRLDYNGGMPDYLQPMIKPAPETATSMPLTHFSFDPNLQQTDPSKFGQGGAGREVARLQGAKGAVGDRTYFYPGEPGAVERETQVGPYRYRGEASSLYDVSKDPMNLGMLARESNRSPFTSNVNPGIVYQNEAMTDLERLAKEYGYEGILNPNVNPPMAMTYGSMPVQRQKKGGRVSMDAMRLAVGGGIRKTVGKTIEEARRLHEAAQNTRSKAAQEAAGLYHPIGGGVKLSKPTELMTSTTIDDPTIKAAPRRIVTLEDLQGGVAIPLVGDRAAAGRILQDVEGQRLKTPVKLQGGPGFMQTHTFEGQPEKSAAWASGKGVVTALGNQARRAAEMAGTDKVLAPYVAMSPTGVDYNTMISRAILGQLDVDSLSKRAVQSFNREVRKVEPRFVGVESPQLESQLFGGSKEAGKVRKAFVDRMGLEEFRQRGFPDVAATRKAVTEPELLNEQLGSTGYNIARLDPEGRIVDDPLIPHETYPMQLRGEYLGSLEDQVPYRDFFQGFSDKRRAFGNPEGSDWRAFSMSAPIQQLDQEWLDRVMKSMGKDKPKEWKKGGQVKRMAEGGQITSDDLMIEERKL